MEYLVVGQIKWGKSLEKKLKAQLLEKKKKSPFDLVNQSWIFKLSLFFLVFFLLNIEMRAPCSEQQLEGSVLQAVKSSFLSFPDMNVKYFTWALEIQAFLLL